MTKDVEKNTEKKCLIYYRYSGETPPVKRRTHQLPRNPRMQPFPESIKTGQNGTKRSIKLLWVRIATLDFSCPMLGLLAPLLKDLQVAISLVYNQCKFL